MEIEVSIRQACYCVIDLENVFLRNSATEGALRRVQKQEGIHNMCLLKMFAYKNAS